MPEVGTTDVMALDGAPSTVPELEYSVRFQHRRTLALHVLPDGAIEVRAPHGLADREIVKFVRSRFGWLLATRERMLRRSQRLRAGRGLEPALSLLGEELRLLLTSGPSRVRRELDALHVSLPDPEDLASRERLLQRWYRKHALEVFSERLARVTARFDGLLHAPPPLRLRRMRRRWGSCSSRGVITLNTELVKLHVGCIDYVIAHELCHLFEFNHGPGFYALLQRVMPEWRTWEQEMRLL